PDARQRSGQPAGLRALHGRTAPHRRDDRHLPHDGRGLEDARSLSLDEAVPVRRRLPAPRIQGLRDGVHRRAGGAGQQIVVGARASIGYPLAALVSQQRTGGSMAEHDDAMDADTDLDTETDMDTDTETDMPEAADQTIGGGGGGGAGRPTATRAPGATRTPPDITRDAAAPRPP